MGIDMDYTRGRRIEPKGTVKGSTVFEKDIPKSAIDRGVTNEMNGLDVNKMVNLSGQGYIFYGHQNIEIGRFVRLDNGLFKCEMNPGAPTAIARSQAREKRAEERRKMRIKRNTKYIAIGLSGIMAITGVISGIKSIAGNHQTEVPTKSQTQYEMSITRSQLGSQPDAVKYRWANYALGAYTDKVGNSEYVYLQNTADTLRTDYLYPICSSYTDYCELQASDMSYLYGTDYAERLHNEFDRNLESFEDRLVSLTNNESLLINNTPYARARVLDETPGVDPTVYIPITSLPDSSMYGMDNIPGDAQVIDGQVYVPDTYLYHGYGMTK